MSSIALIPARAGSRRIPGKNVRRLGGRPLIEYTIEAAQESRRFDKILVSSNDARALEIAAVLGADCLRRPDEYATGTSPDIRWVTHTLGALGLLAQQESGLSPSSLPESACHPLTVFSILRPTAPFRTASTIRRAFDEWEEANRGWNGTVQNRYTSLRAVEPVKQHPGKMWQIRGAELVPLVPQPVDQPFHDSQLAALPTVYVQNASLEIAWVGTVVETGTISGDRILPFRTHGDEGFDLNTEDDWKLAERRIAERGDEDGNTNAPAEHACGL